MKYSIIIFMLFTTSLFSQINNDHLNVGETAPVIFVKYQKT